jgi:LacI family transcriptional regulator
MKDVAYRAGVALKTVSRVVNGEAGVTPETAGKVLTAIGELGYRRNESARLLRTGRTATIGVVADNCGDPEHAALCRGVEEVAREHGFLLFTGSTDNDPARAERLTLSFCARRVDGLVIVPTQGDHSYLISEIEAGIATVFALRRPAQLTADAALVDERGAARTAVQHLISYGHKRIGYLGGSYEGGGNHGGGVAGYRTRQLLAGYAAAMAAAGLPASEAWAALTPRQLRDGAVTAVLCGSREHTALALRTLAAEQARRIAVVGFGDLDLAEFVTPGVTVVAYDSTAVGRAAAGLLRARLDGYSGPPREVVVPVRLIARGSAEISPALA